MTETANIEPQPGLGIEACAQALQRALDAVVDLRSRLAGAEGAAAAWRMILGDALAEGTDWATGDIVTHRSAGLGIQPFVVWHFSATLPNGLPPQLVLVCWPVKRDYTDKVHGEEHYFPANEVTKIGHREDDDA